MYTSIPHTARRDGLLVLYAAGPLLAGGVLTVLPVPVPLRIGLGIVATAALVLLAGLAGRGGRLAPASETLWALAALSVFGWASTAITAIPAVDAWLRAVPVPLAFLVTNATKLTSVLPLLLLVRRRGWTRDGLMLRRGDPAAASGIPYVRWPVLGPVVIVLVAALFLSPLPAAAFGRVGLFITWLPVMLLGSTVNAVSEELLYRHAIIGTARPVIGTGAAVILSSSVFGLAHVTGNPGGLTGVLLTAGYGAVCAAAMLRTRGMCWNVPIHVFGDLSIVTTLLLAGTHAI